MGSREALLSISTMTQNDEAMARVDVLARLLAMIGRGGQLLVGLIEIVEVGGQFNRCIGL